jgi:hypothetical protein
MRICGSSIFGGSSQYLRDDALEGRAHHLGRRRAGADRAEQASDDPCDRELTEALQTVPGSTQER